MTTGQNSSPTLSSAGARTAAPPRRTSNQVQRGRTALPRRSTAGSGMNSWTPNWSPPWPSLKPWLIPGAGSTTPRISARLRLQARLGPPGAHAPGGPSRAWANEGGHVTIGCRTNRQRPIPSALGASGLCLWLFRVSRVANPYYPCSAC